MFNKLYVRIWLAVVMAVAVLTLLVAWAKGESVGAVPCVKPRYVNADR